MGAPLCFGFQTYRCKDAGRQLRACELPTKRRPTEISAYLILGSTDATGGQEDNTLNINLGLT